MTSGYVLFVFILLLRILTNCELQLGEQNVCSRVESFNVTVERPEQYVVEIKKNKWCFSIPPRCTTYTKEIRTRMVNKTIPSERTIIECCTGYTENFDETKCLPVCSQLCVHGTCAAPETCSCAPGFNGAFCDLKCADGWFGDKCQQKCDCVHAENECDHVSGLCSCSEGWKGNRCHEACSHGTFGHNCSHVCACDGLDCDHVTGTCKCNPGWKGPKCKEQCSRGYFGDRCGQQCDCNGSECDHVTGTCKCNSGWRGIRCKETCPVGFFGVQCQQVCECEQMHCNPVTGECPIRITTTATEEETTETTKTTETSTTGADTTQTEEDTAPMIETTRTTVEPTAVSSTTDLTTAEIHTNAETTEVLNTTTVDLYNKTTADVEDEDGLQTSSKVYQLLPIIFISGGCIIVIVLVFILIVILFHQRKLKAVKENETKESVVVTSSTPGLHKFYGSCEGGVLPVDTLFENPVYSSCDETVSNGMPKLLSFQPLHELETGKCFSTFSGHTKNETNDDGNGGITYDHPTSVVVLGFNENEEPYYDEITTSLPPPPPGL